MSSSARIDELRKKFDENPRRYFAPLANEYRKVGDFEQAIFICQEYLPQQPGHMSGHIVFGQALFEAKRLPEARTVFETALTLDPENLIALRHLADISRDLGDTTAARAWYERVLQADPRNEEIGAIMSSMPAAKTLETTAPAAAAPAAAPHAPKPAATPTPGSPAAPTVELSAAAVQEMVRARQAAQQPAAAEPEHAHEKVALDALPTVEVDLEAATQLEGFETTIHEEKLDMPSGGMLGLEPTSAASPPPETAAPAAPLDGLDTISLDDFSLPGAKTEAPPRAASPSPAAATEAPGGLLDLDSFELGGGTTAPAPAPAGATMDLALPSLEIPPALPPAGADLEPLGDFDFDVPMPAAAASPAAPTPPPAADMPTMIMDTVADAIPAMMDIVADVVPAMVEAAVSTPTVIMEAIKVTPPKADEPPMIPIEPFADAKAEAPTQQMDVASVMKEIDAARHPKSEPVASTPAERSAAPFVTETMAQLYLEQGHRAEAIGIYRQLVAARPTDAELRGRLEAIERGDDTQTAKAAAPAPAPAPARREFASGPSIREVLRGLFGIDGQSTNGHAAWNGGGAGAGEVGSIDVLFSAGAVPEDLGPLATAFDGGYVAPSGSIDAVFAAGGQ